MTEDPDRSREVQQLLQQLQDPGKQSTFDAAYKYLRLVRELRLRDSENVAVYGQKFLQQHKHRLKEDELWTVYEQVAVAALDVHAYPLARSLITPIRRRFPNSSRTKRLMSMYCEARGEYNEAQELQKAVLEENPTCIPILKRQVAVEKAKGNLPGAIDLLRKYLDVYQTDVGAWEELAGLYLQASLYQSAAHCYEELLLHNPTSTNLYVQYADVLYTLGGSSGINFRTAQSYYAAAIEMSLGSNVRALYGLCACQAQLDGLKGTSPPEQLELAELSAQTLIRLYQEQALDKLPLVKSVLQGQGHGVS